MSNIAKFAELVRKDKADQVLDAIKETPSLLQEIDEAGVPLVHLFALKNGLPLIGKWLNTKILETIWGQQGWTLAHTAAAAGSADSLRKPLQKNKHLFFWGDYRGRTPVHIAAQHKHLDQLDVESSYLTQRDNLFSTPLHAAALAGSLDQIASKLTAELLLVRNLSEETVLAQLSQSTIPDSLKQVVWEADFLADPAKRTTQNVLAHAGIHLKKPRK